jgi:hypothetical protein
MKMKIECDSARNRTSSLAIACKPYEPTNPASFSNRRAGEQTMVNDAAQALNAQALNAQVLNAQELNSQRTIQDSEIVYPLRVGGVGRVLDVLLDPASYKVSSQVPSVPEPFLTYSYLEQLILDAFHDAKVIAFAKDRQMFDIARSFRLDAETHNDTQHTATQHTATQHTAMPESDIFDTEFCENNTFFSTHSSQINANALNMYTGRVLSEYGIPFTSSGAFEVESAAGSHERSHERFASKYRLDGTYKLYVFMKQHFGYKSRFSWLVCHNQSDIRAAQALMRSMGPVSPTQRLAKMINDSVQNCA